MSNLNDKQKRFCEEYLIDLNATQAAIRSGYSTKTAASIGNENLIKPDIQKYIQELQSELSKKVGITQERVLEEFIKIGLSDIKNYYDSGLKLKEITSLEDRFSGAIGSIKITERVVRNLSGDMETERQIEFKLHDKLTALDKIARHLGFYPKEKVNLTLNLGADAEEAFD